MCYVCGSGVGWVAMGWLTSPWDHMEMVCPRCWEWSVALWRASYGGYR